MTPKKPERQSGSHRLRLHIRESLLRRIIDGKLEAGEALNESRLATQLKVSRTPLREALLQLEREGFVRSDQRRGFSVEPLSARDVREIYPIMWTLEGLAVRSSWVCIHLLAPELARINSEFAKSRDAQQAIAIDSHWHEVLTSQSNNHRLHAIISGLRLSIRRYESLYMGNTQLIPESVARHNAIIRAIRQNDVEGALRSLQDNWRFTLEVLIRKMGEE